MKTTPLSSLLLLGALGIGASCSTAPSTPAEKMQLQEEAATAAKKFKTEDPGMQKFFDSSKGHAIFPSVGKGAVGVGGAYGKGVVYEGGSVVGYCDLSQATIGLQLGGQAYSEVIFFEDQKSLDEFKAGEFAFAAQVSAVAASAGASADAKYQSGVAVFTMTRGGLMYEASIGGQKFDYEPVK